MKYKFCPYCGGKLKFKKGIPHPDCQDCGKTFWQTSFPTASCIILDKQNRILLEKRKISPEKNKWNIPGGFGEPGEDPKETAKREMKEELGIEVKLGELVGVYSETYGTAKYTLCFYYLATILKGTPKPDGKDTSEIKWFKLDSLPRVAFLGETVLTDFKKKFLRPV